MEQRRCTACGQTFSIDDSDFVFYQKMSVPPPTHCPNCRLQRRLAFRVERTFYFRNCGMTQKRILSLFPPDSPLKVFSPEGWYSDKWDALDYGRPFDFSRPFFEQFAELMRDVPLLAVNVVGVQNCDYVNQIGWSKNCYLIIEGDYNEDSLYSHRIFYSKSSMDCKEIFRCERCYECTDCESCFRVLYSQLCRQCSESAFLYDCRGCMNCFGCAGLRQKQNCWFNEQLSKEEYQTKRRAFDFQNPAHMADARQRFEELKATFPRKAMIGEMNENVTGNYLYENKDCMDCFEIRNCRDCRYCRLVRNAKDCMDYFVLGAGAEKIYEAECCGEKVQNLRFCADCWSGSRDLTYCFQCVLSSSNCFGCVGLQKQEYCILNKKYSKEEYEFLFPQIIEHMKKTAEFGEFFPMSISPYAYNETVAHQEFPLTKEEVARRGLPWRETLPFTTGKETIAWSQIAPDIRLISDSIINEVLVCEATGRNFRITAQELKFYKEMALPLPHFHPDERHRRRVELRNPQQLWERSCMKCGSTIKTTYDPSRPETVYCEKCYLEAVY